MAGCQMPSALGFMAVCHKELLIKPIYFIRDFKTFLRAVGRRLALSNQYCFGSSAQ